MKNNRFLRFALVFAGALFLFSLGVVAERKVHVIDFALSMYFKTRTAKYDKQVNPELVEYFGQPAKLGKKKFTYASAENYRFMKKGNIANYEFGPAIRGMVDYFTGPHSAQLRRQSRVSGQDTVKEDIIVILGVREHALGKVTDAQRDSVAKTGTYSIDQIKLTFEHGAVAQYFLGVPSRDKANGRLIIALHGCSSSPDEVMGLGAGDYANAFGRAALEKGYMVIAPYTLNYCDWVDDLDFIGAFNTGTSVFGYELMLVREIASYELDRLEEPIGDKYLWGISRGSILAALLGAIDDSYSKIALDGCVYDFHRYFMNYILPLSQENRRTWQLSRLLYEHEMVDIVKALLPRRVVLGLGAYDAKDTATGFVMELRAYAREHYRTDSMVAVNFFTGYHETNPAVTLKLLESTDVTPE